MGSIQPTLQHVVKLKINVCNFYVYCVNYIPVHVFAAAANFFILVWRKCDCCMVLLLSQPMYIHSGSMLSCPALPAEVITTSSLNNSLHLKCIYPLHTRAYQLGGCSFSQFCQHACCRLTTSSLNNTLWTCAYVHIVHTSKPELFMGLLHIFCIISCTWEASKISTGVPLPYFFLLSAEKPP